jgi:hypothetical protein
MSDNQVSFDDGLDARLSTINILNNNGAACIKNAHFDHAFNTLKEALVCLKRTGEDVKAQQLSGGSKKSSSITVDFLDNGTPTAMRLASSSTTRFTSSSLHTEDGGYIFRDPVRIRSWEDSDYETIFDQLTLAVYYNLGLAILLRCIQRRAPGDDDDDEESSSSSRRSELKKACKILEYALITVQRDTIHVDVLETCALMNNLGQTYRLLEEKELATKCFTNLLNMLMFLVASGEGKKVKQLDNFFTNVMDLMVGAPQTAPVA